MEYLNEIERVFGLSAREDDPYKHPTHFCHSCKRIILKAGLNYQHRTITFDGWCQHDDTSCTVCQHYSTIQRGGRPPKSGSRTSGRPPSISPRYCIQHIRGVAPPSLIPPAEKIPVCKIHLGISVSEFNCPLCLHFLRNPVQLVTCETVVCADCLCSWLHHRNTLECPCCNGDHLQDFSTITSAPSIESLCTVCETCHKHTQLKDYQHHICTPSLPSSVLPQSSICDILHQPLTAPLTPLEQKLQTNLTKRALTSSSEDGILHLKTGGKVNQDRKVHTHNTFPYLLAANLYSSEAGTSTHWKGSTKYSSTTLPIYGECAFNSSCWRYHCTASP